MPKPTFKMIAGAGDWGSPLSDEAAYETLEEAQAAAHEFLVRQRQSGALGAPLRVTIEETRPDGTTVRHSVG